MKQLAFKMSAHIVGVVCCAIGLFLGNAVGQEEPTPATKTIVGDFLMIDRDLYIIRSERGEMQIEATDKTDVAEAFEFGDRIKAVVFMNNTALTIERAGPNDQPGIIENSMSTATAAPTKNADNTQTTTTPDTPVLSGQTKRPDRKIVIGDLLMIDRDLYIVRGERGEMQIEATDKTDVAEAFEFGDRIKAVVLMNNTALTIERASPNDEPGVILYGGLASSGPEGDQSNANTASTPDADAKEPEQSHPIAADPTDNLRVVEGQILMVDGDFYVLRGERGEIRVERTEQTNVTEDFKFGDFIKATVKPDDQAVVIERLQ